MDTAYIQQLYGYNRWANSRIVGVVSALSNEAFTKDMGSSHRSIRDTLSHILSAEWIWLERWKGNLPTGMLDPQNFPTVESLQARWRDVEQEQENFLRSLSDDRLRSIVQYATTGGKVFAQPLWEQMVHVVNHSSYHRGQVVTMLRQVGAQPISTDLIAFFREKQKS